MRNESGTSGTCDVTSGLDRVFEREKRQVDEFVDLITDGLNSVNALNVLANEIENSTRHMVERKRLNGVTEDDIMEDVLRRTHDMGVESPPVPSTGQVMQGGSDPCARALQVGKVLAPHTRVSHGVLSLSEAYRVYNRSRLGDIATPDEFVRACALLETAGVPMRLERGALFCLDGDADRVLKRVVTVVLDAAMGVSRVDVSAETGLPVGVIALYLNRAESRGLVVRDDTPRGVYYHDNKFMSFTSV